MTKIELADMPGITRYVNAEGEKGLSLLEVVIAVAVLTSLALSSLLIVIPVSRQARLNREIATANNEVKRVLEKVQSLPFKVITQVYPDNTQISVGSLQGGIITVTYVDPAADPLVMDATVSWTSPDLGPLQRSFSTVRTE